MRNLILAASAIAVFAGATAPAAFATSVDTGTFTKKQKRISGDWKIVEENGQRILRFSDDFRTRSGPDLKVFLSPTAFGQVNGKNAVNGSINLGELQSTKGGQDYVIPEGVNLDDFNSVLVHCEAYSVLWGGGDL
ncbi:MAG: DM13 domain-containing protein [Pseudomonadota bacterium]